MKYWFAGKHYDTEKMSLNELVVEAHNIVRMDLDKASKKKDKISNQWRDILQNMLSRARLLLPKEMQ